MGAVSVSLTVRRVTLTDALATYFDFEIPAGLAADSAFLEIAESPGDRRYCVMVPPWANVERSRCDRQVWTDRPVMVRDKFDRATNPEVYDALFVR